MNNGNAAESFELMLTDSMRVALDHAFADARECLEADGGMVPFSVLCTSDGFDVSEHPGDTVDDVYISMKTLLAREMPEAYVFSYDGFVELVGGREEAIICEVARRGDAQATILAQTYAVHDGSYEFAPAFAYAGEAPQLYPSGTKPIVSGLVALAAEREAAAQEAGASDATGALDDDEITGDGAASATAAE